MRDGSCDIPKDRMVQAYLAALGGHRPSARLLAMYADFAWNVMDDHELGERIAIESVKAAPNEPAYRITLARMLIASGQPAKAKRQIAALQSLNIGGALDSSITELEQAMSPTP
jgi:predicted Zn-dependent protease